MSIMGLSSRTAAYVHSSGGAGHGLTGRYQDTECSDEERPRMVATSTSRPKDDQGEQPRTPGVPAAPVEHVLDLLEDRVPLSLLIDLAAPSGPDSLDILETEGAPAHAWWEQG